MKKILLILIILLTCGCSYQEIENTSIVCGIGIKYDNNKYNITYEIINSNKEHNSDKQSYTLSGTGSSLDEAINNINNNSPKTISLKHLEIILINDTNILNELNNYLDINKYYKLLVKDNNIDEILNYRDDAYPINSIAIKYILKNNNIYKNEVKNINLKDKFIID